MKYKVGDKVRVREDLIVGEKYGNDTFTSKMIPFKGKIVTIKKIVEDKYEIEEDSQTWWWTYEMLLPVTKYKIGDKAIVREDLEVGKEYGEYVFISAMNQFKGKIVTIYDIITNGYGIIEDHVQWCWSDEMFSGKVSKDFSPKESILQSTFSEKENFYDIITVKTTKLKLYF